MARAFFITFFIAAGFFACTTYDYPIVYHKNFIPGKSEKLRFDGYYADSFALQQDLRMENYAGGITEKPVFFYNDGSAFSATRYWALSDIPVRINNNQLTGSWGNYKINADTIFLERFDLIGTNYRRIILRGIISSDRIHWISRKDHVEEYKPVDYTIWFHPFASKPDSTLNWTRQRKKYNQ